MRLACLPALAVCACSAFAAISNVSVVGSTNVQALITYQAPDNGSCTVAVSESPTLSPLVHDVDPALFPGSNSDARPGSLVDGANRTFAVGKRSVEKASDGNWYSRALQTDTTHYFLITCGSDTARGSFHTANIPVGITYPWPAPQDPASGNFRWPTLNGNDRTQTIIDPNYGTLIKRVSVPGDAPAALNTQNQPFSSAQGNNWNNPNAALADDGASATYSGAGRDWLVLTNSALSSLADFYVGSTAIDSIAVHVNGSSQGGSAGQRTIEVCLTLDGANCSGQIRSVALDSTASTKTLGGGPPLDIWGMDTLWPAQVARNKNFGVMIRAGADTQDLSIQYAGVDVNFSAMVLMPDAGFWQVCSHVKSNGGYHCVFQDSLATDQMFWIQPDTGEVRWLGKMVITNWGGPDSLCVGTFAAFDVNNPNVFYCDAQLSDGSDVLVKGAYTGNDAAQPPGSLVPMNWVNLTPPGSTIPQLIHQFDPTFDPALYSPQLSFITSHYAVYKALRAGQDTLGWLAVLDLGNSQPIGSGGTAQIVAAVNVFTAPATRWCSVHTTEFVGHTTWVGFDPHTMMSGGTVATGPYQVTLLTPLPASTGAFTVQVSGEPQPYLMNAQPGDVFQIVGGTGWDFLQITQKLSPTMWTVQRTVTGTTPPAYPSGTLLSAFCSAIQLNIPNQGAYTYWDFLNDPHGQQMTVEKQLTGGHIVQRSNYRIMESSDGYSVVTPGFPQTLNQPRSYHVVGNPPWAGAQAGNFGYGLGYAYQQHESYENYDATGPGRSNWFVDSVPFAGAFGYTPSLTPVAGASQVYKYTPTRLNRGIFPTFATCGGRQLKDVSPGPITDQTNYSYCVGSGCAPGAADSEVYVSCPPPVSAKSYCNQYPGGDFSAVCVGDYAPYGQAVVQYFLDSSGMRNRVLTNAMYAYNSPQSMTYFDTAYSLPDGSWVLFASWGNNGRKDVYMVKVPQQPDFPSSTTSGTQPVMQSINISPPSGAAQTLVSVGNPSGMSQPSQPPNCSGGAPCTITVPAVPNDIVLSSAQFLDGSGHQLGGLSLQAMVVGGAPGSGIGSPGVNGVTNAFSFLPNLAPGAIASIFGSNMADCAGSANAFPLPASLCDAGVTFNGTAAYLFYAGPNQINALVPSSLQPAQDVSVVVTRAGSASSAFQIPASQFAPVAPALASYSPDGQTLLALVSNSDGSIAGPNQPALNTRPLHPGENATAWAVGMGPTMVTVPDGEPAPSNPLAWTSNNVDVFVNGMMQKVTFAGLAPTLSGLYQINFTLDPSTPLDPSGNNVIWTRVKQVESPHLPIVIGR
jgi:uncharacterized protein (TIGR03437 family)